jgi:hypothetical protein
MSGEADHTTLKELSEKVIEHSTRWIAELSKGPIRRTLEDGIMHKCARHVEQVLRECAEALLPHTGEKGQAAVRDIVGVKRLDRLTMGQWLLLLKRLGQMLDRVSPADRRLLDAETSDLLDDLSQARNAFVHANPHRDGDRPKIIPFLIESIQLCRSRLVEAAIAYQENKSPT